ncbi:MAG: hypothetical protein ABIH86_06260 [Planctomycetota bacterium]
MLFSDPKRHRAVRSARSSLPLTLAVALAVTAAGCWSDNQPDANRGFKIKDGDDETVKQDFADGASVRVWLEKQNRLNVTADDAPPAPTLSPERRAAERQASADRQTFFQTGETGNPPSEARVREGLAGRDLYICHEACAIAGREKYEGVVPELIALLGAGKPVSPAAAWALGRINTDAAADALLKEYKTVDALNIDFNYRMALIEAVGRTRREIMISPLVKTLGDAIAIPIKVQIFDALYQIGTPNKKAIAEIKRQLNDPSLPASARLAAAPALAKMGETALAESTFDKNWPFAPADVRARALAAVRHLSADSYFSRCVFGMLDPNPIVWTTAVRLAADIDDDAADDKLYALAQSRPEPLKTRLALTLGLRGWGIASRDIYAAMTQTDDEHTAVLALEAAAVIGRTEWRNEIQALLDSPSPSVRVAAAWTLAMMNFTDALEPILSASRSGSIETRAQIFAAYKFLQSSRDETLGRAASPTVDPNSPIGPTDFMADTKVIQIEKNKGAILKTPGRPERLFLIGEHIGAGYVLDRAGDVRVSEALGRPADNDTKTALMVVLASESALIYLSPDGSSSYRPRR